MTIEAVESGPSDDATTADETQALDDDSDELGQVAPPASPPPSLSDADRWQATYLVERQERINAQIALLTEQRTRLETELAEARNEQRAFNAGLSAKYGLGPSDRVALPEGAILRATPPPAPAPATPSSNGKG